MSSSPERGGTQPPEFQPGGRTFVMDRAMPPRRHECPQLRLQPVGSRSAPVAARAQVHWWTDARKTPKSSNIFQNIPTRKTPFRPASTLRKSFHRRDIRSGPRLFGESKSIVGHIPRKTPPEFPPMFTISRGAIPAPTQLVPSGLQTTSQGVPCPKQKNPRASKTSSPLRLP